MRMTHLATAALLLSGLLASAMTQAATILVLGDSISAGYGLPLERGWVNLLQRRLNTDPAFARGRPHRVINASVSGETTSGGLARLPRLLATYRPDVLVIELGGNDGLRGQPPQLIASNLNRMIQLGKQSRATVVLAGMRIPPNYGNAYANAFYNVFGQVARQQRISHVPFFLEKVGGNPGLMQSDGIHPNVNAQQQLLNNILPVLKPLIR